MPQIYYGSLSQVTRQWGNKGKKVNFEQGWENQKQNNFFWREDKKKKKNPPKKLVMCNPRLQWHAPTLFDMIWQELRCKQQGIKEANFKAISLLLLFCWGVLETETDPDPSHGTIPVTLGQRRRAGKRHKWTNLKFFVRSVFSFLLI